MTPPITEETDLFRLAKILGFKIYRSLIALADMWKQCHLGTYRQR